jgi:carboxymethylenebutenolidase
MKRLVAFAFMLAAIHATAWAAEEAVTFKSGEGTASGVLVTPEGKGPFPGLVVIQEWWGLNDWVKEQARALAKEGYVSLAVDLYHGKVTATQEEAHQLMMGLARDQGLRDLEGAVAYLKARADVKKEKIGTIGWCMGGGYALGLAVDEPSLAAVVAYYGAPPTEPASIAKIQSPILGNYGAEDKGPAPEQVRAFEAALKKAGKSIDVKIYEGAGHAFANPSNPWHGYREDAAKDAWARTTAFLAAHLKK